MMTVAGVCTGVGGFDLAFQLAGFRILWGCELDQNCRDVLKARFPDTPFYLDMTWPDLLNAPSPDVFVGGTPCQGFSVAGLRKGLNDDRSNLALRFLGLCNHHKPKIVLWENVPGVLSDKDNAFGCFLAGLVGADAPLVPTAESGGRWTDAGVAAGPQRTAAWRVLDSQYFGVAQRRNRVFVVASPRADLPFQILFESEGGRRHFAPSREAGQRASPTLEGRSGRSGGNGATSGGLAEVAPTISARNKGGGGLGTDAECDGALIPFGGGNTQSIEIATTCNTHGGTGRHDFESETLVAHALRAEGFDASEDGTGRSTPLVPVTVGPLTACGGTMRKHGYGSGQQEVEAGHVIPILEAGARTGKSTTDPRAGIGVGNPNDPMFTLQEGKQHAVAFEYKKDGADHGDIAPTLRATEFRESHANGGGHIAVAFTERTRADGRNFECQEECAYALTNPGSGGRTHSRQIVHGYAVRRLTPTECERLQAFPDSWTAVPNTRGKPMADGPRYRMMGNAVTVSVVAWLARRIASALPKT